MYELDFSVVLGSTQTGLSLEAQLVDSSGSNVGSPITTGFTEIGGGNYLWHTSAVPTDHRGGVIFRVAGGGTIKAFTSINPEETEGKVDLKETGLDDVMVESDVNARQALSIMAAVLAGVLRQTDANHITVRAANNPTVQRVFATVNTIGERLEVDLSLPS